MQKETVFMFSGQGSQYNKMGLPLYESHAPFRECMDRLDRTFNSLTGHSVVETLYRNSANKGARLDDIFYSHPALFMVQYALAETFKAAGVRPDYVLGVSLGEYAALAVSSVLQPEQALELIVRQVELLRNTCRPGSMIAVLDDASLFDRHAELYERSERIAVNYELHFTIACSDEALEGIQDFLREKRIMSLRLPVPYAFHSAHIDALKAPYTEVAGGFRLNAPQIPVVSSARGGVLSGISGELLWDVLRLPMDFRGAVLSLPSGRERLYLDLGPSGTLENFCGYLFQDPKAQAVRSVMTPMGNELKKLDEAIALGQQTNPTRNGCKSKMKSYLFPGQGAQSVGMGGKLFQQFPELTRKADEVLGYSIEELCLKNEGKRLDSTAYTQPALYVVNALSYLQDMQETGEKPDYVAGHSLGEYSALYAAGVFDFETGLRIVKKRAELMHTAAGGGMAAVLGLTESQVRAILSEHRLDALDIANLNTPTQIAISGPKDAIAAAQPVFEGNGAASYIVLNVSGAFHSRYLHDAAAQFKDFLQQFTFSEPAIPVIANLTARPYPKAGIARYMAEQMVSGVKWCESVRFLMGKHPEMELKQIGPGHVIIGLVAKIKREAEPLFADDAPAELDDVQDGRTEAAAAAEAVEVSAAVAGEDSAFVKAQGAVEAPAAVAAPRAIETNAPSKKVELAARSAVVSPPVEAPRQKAREEVREAAVPSSPGSAVKAPAAAPLVEAVALNRPAVVEAPAETVRAEKEGRRPVKAASTPGERLGSSAFKRRYGLKLAYLLGGMNEGISSAGLVTEAGKSGCLAFLGAGGMSLPQVEASLSRIRGELGDSGPFGVSVAYHPVHTEREERLIDLLLRSGVNLIEAASYLTLTPSLVKYRLAGLAQEANGDIRMNNRIIAKVSRPDIAQMFMLPPPERMVERLLKDGQITRRQAELSLQVTMADDICACGDSAGPTDQASLISLLPTLIRLKKEISSGFKPAAHMHIGAAGGIGTPEAAAGVFLMGADFIMTGSINQCTVESGASPEVKDILEQMNVCDTAYVPSLELFELGGKAQVVKKGFFFSARANKLYELYRNVSSFAHLDGKTRSQLEDKYFGRTIASVLEECRSRLTGSELSAWSEDSKQQMAAVFKWYMERARQSAIAGDASNKVNYSIMCGPAMGAFNQWVKNTSLERWKNRHAGQIAAALMDEAAALSKGGAV